jgi:hypothetical protein
VRRALAPLSRRTDEVQASHHRALKTQGSTQPLALPARAPLTHGCMHTRRHADGPGRRARLSTRGGGSAQTDTAWKATASPVPVQTWAGRAPSPVRVLQ